MANRIGNGLPSTVTATRIKAVLGLTKSQEHTLGEALETGASRAWTETASNGDPYERLHALLATVEGRRAYEEARIRFQNTDNKQFVRTDFPNRVLESRRNEAFGQSVAKEFGGSSNQDLIERLVENNAWAYLAEVVWAEGLVSGDGERLLATITDHPETRPYLEQVQAGLLQVEDDEAVPDPEDEGEAAELVGRVRRVAEGLDIDHLDQCDLFTLSRDALRLADIAKARNIRDRDVSLQKIQIEEWEARNAEAIAGATMVVDALAVLRARMDQLPHLRKDGREIVSLENLEIGDLAAQARLVGVPEPERQRLQWLRRVRNALAHNKVVSWQTLTSPIAIRIVDFRAIDAP